MYINCSQSGHAFFGLFFLVYMESQRKDHQTSVLLFYPKTIKIFVKKKVMEKENSPQRLHNSTRMVDRAIQTLTNLIIASLEDKIGFTENKKRVLRVMWFSKHTGHKLSLVELHHARKLRTELTDIVKRNENYFSDWTTINVSVPLNQIPIHVERN